MKVSRYFLLIYLGFKSLIIGLMITFREARKPPVTLQYPHEKPDLGPAFRGAIKLITFEDTASHDCVACLQCERICPSACIAITGGKVDGIKKKRAETFSMDFALCSLCGLCLDVCPTTTLEWGRGYDVSGYDRDGFVHDLLSPYSEFEPEFRKQQFEREEAERLAKEAAKAAKLAAKKKKEEAKQKKADAPKEEAKQDKPAAETASA